MSAELSREERAAFREMAARFAKRSVAPLLQHESPDGELGRVPAVLAEAHETGLLASADPAAPGHETGVWGRHTLEQGPRTSLMLLEELAVVCAGVAMTTHVQGLGSLLLMMAKDVARPPARVAAAAWEGGFLPGEAVLVDPSCQAPARIETVAMKKGKDYSLRGRKDFVFQAPDTEAYVIFTRMENSWAAFLIPANTVGLKVEALDTCMGLRACQIVHLVLQDTVLPADALLKFDRSDAEAVMEFLRLWSLGLVAIGAGAARGALVSARAYAHERYQGCTEIINHPGMTALLADAEAGIMVCQGLVERAAIEIGSPRAALLAALKARLAGMQAAALAVTNCLQIFGGYGYMEDYRMEKRYRDVNALKSAGGSARELRRLIAALAEEV